MDKYIAGATEPRETYEEPFQIQPDPEPFDFELASMLAVSHSLMAGEERPEADMHRETARILRDAIERLR